MRVASSLVLLSVLLAGCASPPGDGSPASERVLEGGSAFVWGYPECLWRRYAVEASVDRVQAHLPAGFSVARGPGGATAELLFEGARCTDGDADVPLAFVSVRVTPPGSLSGNGTEDMYAFRVLETNATRSAAFDADGSVVRDGDVLFDRWKSLPIGPSTYDFALMEFAGEGAATFEEAVTYPGRATEPATMRWFTETSDGLWIWRVERIVSSNTGEGQARYALEDGTWANRVLEAPTGAATVLIAFVEFANGTVTKVSPAP